MVYTDTRFNSSFLQLSFFIENQTPTHRTLSWSLLPQPDTDSLFPADCYNVYYNIVPNNDYILLTKTPIPENTFVHEIASYVKMPRGYYVIEALNKERTKSLKSKEFDIYVPFDELALKMSKEFMWVLMNHHDHMIDNIPFWLYTKKPFGSAKCPVCYKSNIGSIKSKCPTCLGTGFEGGFNFPILGFGTYSAPFNKTVVDLGSRISQEVNQQLQTLAEFALIDVGDYIREAKPPFRLWAVTNVSTSEYNNRPLKLFLNLQLEESGHPLWNVDLPTVTFPKHIHYFNVRDQYNAIYSSINRTTKTTFASFSEQIQPTVTSEASGIIKYRHYIEQSDFLPPG